jgi:hypothetical protein
MRLLKNAEILLQKIIDMKRFLIGLVVFGIVQVHAQADPLQRMEVMMKMLSLKNALLAKDSITLSSLLSDEVSYGHSNGLIQSKNQLIRSVVSGEQDYKSIEPADMSFGIYENTVVVTMKGRFVLNYNGQPLDLNMFVTLVWIKKIWKGKNSDWELVARQSVKLN